MKEVTANLLESINQVEMALSRNDKTFTREFPVLGMMTGTGASIDQCERWITVKDKAFLLWNRASVSIHGAQSVSDVILLVDQYSQARLHRYEIIAAIKADKYVKAFAAIGEDVLAAEDRIHVSLDMKSLEDEMGISVFYTLDDGCVELFIKDGKLVRTSFSIGNCHDAA